MDKPEDKHSHNIDALEALAEGQNVQASGSEDASAADAADTGPGVQWADEEELVGGQEEPAVIEGVPMEADGLAARKARAATFQTQHRIAHAHQYKRTMIPLLLVVGVLLFILSGVTMFVLLTGRSAGGAGPEMSQNLLMRNGVWLVVFAMPLGAILLVGAWLFHRDVSQAERK
ncbi:MAG: hypothetical protein SVT52_07900 [Planctomycetota bacterium]|nr:hypothetical protein [Planctomycetota bacterium]